jgi:phage terminase large subunit-like protein
LTDWDTSCPDWEERLLAGRSLVPDLPLYREEADKALRVFKRLRIPDVIGTPTNGEAAGPWLFPIVEAIFGSYDAVANRRALNEVFWLIPKKNWKTGAAACIMLTALILNRRPEAELTLIAPTKDVADRAFQHCDGSIRLDAALSKLFHTQNHIRTITHRNTGAKLQVKAADTDIVTGIRSAYILIDETHVFANKSAAHAIFVEIRGALAARPDGFLIQITTQSKSPPVGVFRTELHNARDVRDGKLKLPLLPILYELPARIANDGAWKEKCYWPLVNPNINRSVDEGFLERELMKAERDGVQALALFASQHFNIEIGINLRTDRWPGAEYWLDRADPTLTYQEVLARSDVIVVGIDGGGLDDLFGLAVLGRDKQTKDWLLWSHAWCHVGVLTRRRSIAQHLLDFEADGDLTIVEDIAVVDPEIVSMIAEIKNRDILGAVAADSEGPFGEFVDLLDQIEVTQDNKLLVGVNQGIRLMRAIKTAERRLASGTMRHHGSRLMGWAIGNLKIEATATALRATKANAGDAKIDPAMALFDAVDVMIANPDPKLAPAYQLYFA